MSDERSPLIDELRQAGAGLTGGDIPTGSELARVVGGLVASLDHAGSVTVPDELLNPPDPQPVGPVSTANLEDTVAKLQARLDELEAERAAQAKPPEPDPAVPSEAPAQSSAGAPAAPVQPVASETSSSGSGDPEAPPPPAGNQSA